MADWSKRFSATYRFVRVSRLTGLETERLTNIKTGGKITRNQDTSTYESASIDYVGSIDVGIDLIRIYLDAVFTDGSVESVALGTFVASTPSATLNGGLATGSADLYGRLKELYDDDFDTPYAVTQGTNAVQAAMAICKEVGLEVIADDSDYTLSATWVFGTGSNGEDDPDNKLAAVNKLLDAAGFNSAKTDPYGRVIMTRYKEPSKRPIAWEFIEGASARFLSEVKRTYDVSEIANVVHCDYTSQDDTIRGTAVDSAPESPYSTVNVGRRIVKRYTYNDLPEGNTAAQMQANANTRAQTLMDTERSVIYKVEFDHVYAPVTVGDAITMQYTTAGVTKNLAIRTQDIELGAGCLISCEARAFER